MREQAFTLAALGDRKVLGELLGMLESIDPEDRFVRDVRARTERDRRGGIDVDGLLF